MKKSAKVVIGSGFGDEGKGLATDFFAQMAGSNHAVIRFNGGAQAGHTVETGLFKRNVFHSLSSGTFAGAETIWGPEFIFNPIAVNDEITKFEEKFGKAPKIFCDPKCIVTFPLDMLMNQIIERIRSKSKFKHGSCGLGINETVKRNELANKGLAVSSNEILSDGKFSTAEFLSKSHMPYAIERVHHALSGIIDRKEIKSEIERYDIDEMYRHFINAVESLKSRIEVSPVKDAVAKFDSVTFEGAQGLMLDRYSRFFPHVTNSNTGLDNVIPIAIECGITDLDVHYVTRTYATRHGAGPFPTENSDISFPDETNFTNEHQDNLRFGLLSLDLLQEFISIDFIRATAKSAGMINLYANTFLTWANVIDDLEGYMDNWTMQKLSGAQRLYRLIEAIDKKTKSPVRYISHDKTSRDCGVA